jgi:hypothetical protein
MSFAQRVTNSESAQQQQVRRNHVKKEITTWSRYKKRSRLKDNCVSLGIEYIEQRQDETDDEKSARHHRLNTAIKNKKKYQSETSLYGYFQHIFVHLDLDQY